MAQAVTRILADAEQLSADERADLTDHLVVDLANHVPSDIEQAQFAKLQRRIAQVDAGEVQLIPGEEFSPEASLCWSHWPRRGRLVEQISRPCPPRSGLCPAAQVEYDDAL